MRHDAAGATVRLAVAPDALSITLPQSAAVTPAAVPLAILRDQAARSSFQWMTLRFGNRVLQVCVAKAAIEKMIDLGALNAVPRHLLYGRSAKVRTAFLGMFRQHVRLLLVEISART
ncbi:MAG TPA: hypothetical protein PLD10_26060 [Rhodopila sp.]|nr:hypothetical protein [Rhodopila sp.]